MTTEYSRSVDWSEEYEQWRNIGQEVMQEFYADNPKEAEADGHDLDENGEVKYLDEVLDDWQPMMNYAYPLQCDPTLFDDGTDRIIRVCRETCLTVMYNDDEDCYYLALCGGGMDLSQSIARAYQILENWLPVSLLSNVCKQPQLSVHGKAWQEMADQIIKQLELAVGHFQADIGAWQAAKVEYLKQIAKRAKC